ncbi:hypothetical protein ACFE04_024732 [Oxalis oulophora]
MSSSPSLTVDTNPNSRTVRQYVAVSILTLPSSLRATSNVALDITEDEKHQRHSMLDDDDDDEELMQARRRHENPSSASFVDEIVVPGDVVLNLSKLTNQTIRLRGGLRQESDALSVTKAGKLRCSKQNSKYWVETSHKRYVPSVGDHVLGIVVDQKADNFLVDIKGQAGVTTFVVAGIEFSKRIVSTLKSQMQTIITKALTELDIKPVPSKRKGSNPLLAVDNLFPMSLPENLFGDQWAFVQLPYSAIKEELLSLDKRFGAGLDLDYWY